VRTKKYVLSIAGFDPSAGAGILSDIKTFEAHNVNGLGVCTCLTYQNELKINGISWIAAHDIIEQLKPLFEQYHIDHVKIGLIENIETLETVASYLQDENPEIKIIWDPILKSSSGFDFHGAFDTENLRTSCKRLFLITPNTYEITHLISDMTPDIGAEHLSEFSAVLLKGGHSANTDCTDQLFTKDKVITIKSPRLNTEKHGTGCVLSSAITANLANEMSLPAACESAKKYVYKFLQSDHGLVGQHSYENAKTHS